ncbi:glycosyltransferase family 4 protein [Phocaeicola sp.]
MKTHTSIQILIDGRSSTPQLSGISRYIIELTKGYARQYGEENLIIIVNHPISYLPFKQTICPYKRHDFRDNIKFSIWLSKQNYEIYHSGDMIGPFWHKKGVKHIITCHDLMHLVVPGFFQMNPIKAMLRRLRIKIFLKYIIKDADEIISVSKTTHDDLMRIYHVDSIILREGINHIKHKKDSTKYMDLKNDSFFLYVGSGSAHKNIDFMINAFLATDTEKKLVICGKNHHVTKSDRIIYTGYIEDNDLDYLYRNCSAFIFPSKYEGFGLPILEALSYHCKVFSSNAGSLGEFSPEIVHFFNPNKEKELIELINKCDKITNNHNAIDTYLKKFDWKTIWQEFHNTCC